MLLNVSAHDHIAGCSLVVKFSTGLETVAHRPFLPVENHTLPSRSDRHLIPCAREGTKATETTSGSRPVRVACLHSGLVGTSASSLR